VRKLLEGQSSENTWCRDSLKIKVEDFAKFAKDIPRESGLPRLQMVADNLPIFTWNIVFCSRVCWNVISSILAVVRHAVHKSLLGNFDIRATGPGVATANEQPHTWVFTPLRFVDTRFLHAFWTISMESRGNITRNHIPSRLPRWPPGPPSIPRL
jgi:hypothetical protein